MLSSLTAVAATLTLPILGGAALHADDFLPDTKNKVTAGAQCQEGLTPTCTASIKSQQTAKQASTPNLSQSSSPPTCYYKDFFRYAPPESVQDAGAPSEMKVEEEVCPSADSQVVGTPLNFTWDTPAVPAAIVKGLVEQAAKSLNVPPPQVSLSPAANSTQYVGVPLWAWTPPSSWVPKSVTVSAGGTTLTMTATPKFTVWSIGDGGSMTCWGPGTPYPVSGAQRPPERSPDCGYVYSKPSTSQSGRTFPVTAATHWKVVWSTTTGVSGSEPDLAATSSLQLHVSEIQALVTGVRL